MSAAPEHESPESVALATTGSDAIQQHSRKAVDNAVDKALDKALGDQASPELKKAAADIVAPWAERFVRWLDDVIRIPGTKFGIGLDPIIGMILPGAGDAITGTGSIALLFLGLKERVPTIILARMCLNILVDTIGGLVPIVGDAFDVVWRSNRRNLDLVEKFRDDPKAEPTVADYLLVTLGVLLAIASIVLPFVIIYGIGFGVIWGFIKAFAE